MSTTIFKMMICDALDDPATPDVEEKWLRAELTLDCSKGTEERKFWNVYGKINGSSRVKFVFPRLNPSEFVQWPYV